MNLYHLRYFVTLAYLEHYTRAAEQLSITQPSLSHAISSLEKELKVQLFEKEGRNVVLTKYGKSFLKDVEKILGILDYSVSNLQMSGSGEGTIDIGFVRILGTTFLPKLMRGFLAENPDKDINFRLHNAGGLSSNILEALKQRKYDIAFCSKYTNDPTIDFVPVATQQMVVAVPLDHPLAERDSVSLKETLPYPHIMFSRKSGFSSEIRSLFDKIGEFPEVNLEAEEDQVIAGMVAENFGIAIMPNIHILDTLPVKKLHITEPLCQHTYYMASLKDSYVAPLVTNFKNYIIRHPQSNMPL